MTPYGPFDGNAWEHLCQQVFKKKFADAGYLHIPATPGDFGLEGFTKTTGFAFQCYCPNQEYTTKDLYEKQRNKITADLNKLKKNERDLKLIFGTTTLKRWHLVTPKVAHNDLLKHLQVKEAEVRKWQLSILDPGFELLVHDCDHYAAEIQELLHLKGAPLDFGGLPTTLKAIDAKPEIYEDNVLRKTKARLQGRFTAEAFDAKVNALNRQTLKEFLDHDAHFKRINEQAPTVHARLIKLINGYEADVVEQCALWDGTPQELTVEIRDTLAQRIARELGPHVSETEANHIARLMVARWIAVCELDYV